MKKKIITAFLLLAAVVSMAGCGGKDSSTASTNPTSSSKSESAADASALVKAAIDSGVKFGDMTDVAADKVSFYYPGIEEGAYSDFSAKIEGSGGLADEVVVFKASSSDKVDKLKEALEKRIEKQKKSFDGYVPAEFDKLGEASVKTSGDYVYLIVSSDNAKAEKALKAAIK